MKMFKISLTLAGRSTLLAGCAGQQLSDYQGSAPPMQFDQFFNGPLQGHGLVQDRGGTVIKRFDVDMYGVWHGNEGTLYEHFVYYDGKVIDRAWHIRKLANGRFVAGAPDIEGQATGETQGTAIQWQYVMDVPADNGKTYAVSFDDWMYQMHDNTVLNRNDMHKFGVYVGTLSIVEQRQPAGTRNLAYAADRQAVTALYRAAYLADRRRRRHR